MIRGLFLLALGCSATAPAPEPVRAAGDCEVPTFYEAPPFNTSIACAPGSFYVCLPGSEAVAMDYWLRRAARVRAALLACPHIKYVD